MWEFPITRILAFLLLLGLLAAGLGFGVVGIRLLAHAPQRRDDFSILLGEAVSAAAALLAFALMKRWADRQTAEDAGLPVRGIFSETAIGLLIGGGVFSASIGMLSAFRVFTVGGVNTYFSPLLPLALFLCIAISEEVIFRGYVFQTLERRWGSGVALVGSGLFFGLAHLVNPIGAAPLWQKLAGPVFISFEASILMTAAYLLTRRLWLPIGIHWGWNLFEATIYGVPDSGLTLNSSHLLFMGRLHGPFLLTGGAFGPEAGLACLICGTYAGILLLRMAIRKGQWRGLPTASPHLATADTERTTP